MKLVDTSVHRSTTVLVLLLLIVIMGVYAFFVLPRENEPEIVIPMTMVTVRYEGVSPQDMETLVTMPIERKLTGISGVKKITSTTNEGTASIVVEFETDVNVDDAIQKVKDKVDLAKADLPEDADEPLVTDMNTAESPVIQINLTGPLSRADLTKIAERMQDDLEALNGVLEVNIIGDVEREIQIIVDPARLTEYGVSLSDLAQLASLENVNVPAGSMDVGHGKYTMRVPGEIQGPEDLRDLVVKRGENGVVYLRDLATVQDGFKEPQSYARLDFEPSVTLVVKKRAGVNVLKVAQNVRALIDEARPRLPAGVRLDITLDESTRIDKSMWQLTNSIITGLFLVGGVILIFLGLSDAFFVALAIPISMLITFVAMYVLGLTFNMVTLFSLMVALGMLVDNGIVVVENIHRHIQEGLPRVEAAKKGASEVAWPIIGSTLTTVAAFFPLIFWPGMMGNFMSLLPKTVIITLFASLFVGIVVNPALASRFAKRDAGPSKREPGTHPVLNLYGRVLRLALRWRTVTVAAAVCVILTIVGVWAAEAQFEFLSTIEPDRAHVNIEMAEGTNLDATDAVARRVEAIVGQESDKLDYITTSVGSLGPSIREGMPGASTNSGASHIARVSLVFPDFQERKELPSSIINRIRNAFDHIPGAEIRVAESSMGPPQSPPVNIELSGEDFGVLSELSRQVRAKIEDVNGLVDLHDDMERGKPEVQVVVDRQQAKLANLNTQYIGATVQAAIHGRKAGEYRVGDDEYDVTVKFPEWFREDVANLEGMALVNLQGHPIPFSSVARLDYGAGPGSIKRIDRKRTVTVIGDAEGRPGQEVLRDVQARLEDFKLPAGYTLSYTGERQEVMESGQFMVKAFGVALLLIALVLITQFNSLIQPLIIMSSVIMSLGGVFLGLLVFQMPFGFMMTGIGCISLAGIVVNNAIVLVDFINSLKATGLETTEAIVTACKLRFRPVLLTAATTVLGLLPLGLGISFDFRRFQLSIGGDQSSYWGSMAVAIIFGLSFATVLTLIVVPTLYSLSESVSHAFRRRHSREESGAYAADAELVAK